MQKAFFRQCHTTRPFQQAQEVWCQQGPSRIPYRLRFQPCPHQQHTSSHCRRAKAWEVTRQKKKYSQIGQKYLLSHIIDRFGRGSGKKNRSKYQCTGRCHKPVLPCQEQRKHSYRGQQQSLREQGKLLLDRAHQWQYFQNHTFQGNCRHHHSIGLSEHTCQEPHLALLPHHRSIGNSPRQPHCKTWEQKKNQKRARGHAR